MSLLAGFIAFVRENKEDAISLLYLAEEESLKVESVDTGKELQEFSIFPEAGPGVTVRYIPTSTTRVAKTFRTFKSLFNAGFTVAEPLAFCDDTTYLGSEFIVEAYIPGRTFDIWSLSELPAQERSQMLLDAVNKLSVLHGSKPSIAAIASSHPRRRTVATEALTAFSHFQDRAIDRHGGRSCDTCRMMHDLNHWLQSVPEDPDNSITTLIHGSLSFSCFKWHPTEPKIVSISGWFNAGIGNPLLDFYHCFAPLAVLNESGRAKQRKSLMEGVMRLDTLEWEYSRSVGSGELFTESSNFQVLKILGLFQGACTQVDENPHSEHQQVLVATATALVEMPICANSTTTTVERELQLPQGRITTQNQLNQKLIDGLSIKKFSSGTKPLKNRKIWMDESGTCVMIGKRGDVKTKRSSKSKVKSVKLSDILSIQQGPDLRNLPKEHKVSHPSRYLSIVTPKSSIQILATSSNDRDVIASQLESLILKEK